jgi:hypothetical protein
MTEAHSTSPVRRRASPDPVFGLGFVLLGILVMGVGGAATWHFVFNAGTGLALLGAVLFVGSVALSTLRRADG